MTIGEQIRKRRLELNLSQKELGKQLGVSQQQIAQYENGKRIPKFTTVLKLAYALHVDGLALLEIYQQDIGSRDYSEDIIDQTPENSSLESTADEKKTILNKMFCELNESGKDKAIEQIELLTKISEYRQENGADSELLDE